MTPTLLVLAAGMGSRYGGLKQIDPMGPHGETVMDYAIFDAQRAGFGRVVFVIRQEFEDAFRTVVLPRYAGHLPVDLCFQDLRELPAGFSLPADREKPWGTAHAILAARHVVREPFAAINADDFYGRQSYATLAAFLEGPLREAVPPIYAMVGFELRHTLSAHGTVARGICRTDDRGRLIGVREMTRLRAVGDLVENQESPAAPDVLRGDEPVSLNMWGFTPAIFPQIEEVFREFLATRGDDPTAECYIPTVVDALIARGACEVHVLPTTSRWFGVTYREDKAAVVTALADLTARGDYPSPLWG
jgi:hypothetical protein